MKLIITLFLIYSFTPFPAITPATDSITVKGGLLTNDGTSQVESPPCANGEIIEWDSTVTLGYKCVSKPVASAPNYAISPAMSSSSSTSSVYPSFNTVSSIAITTTGGPIKAQIISQSGSFGECTNFLSGTSDTSYIAMLRGSTEVIIAADGPDNPAFLATPVSITVIEFLPAGTYTYSLAHATLTGNGSSIIDKCQIFLEEIK